MSIDAQTLKAEILSLAADDYTGLYEIVWWLNAQAPGGRHEDHVAIALPIVKDLIAAGSLRLFKAAWASDSYTPISTEQSVAVVSDPDSWQDPEEQPYVCFAAV